MNCCLFIRNVIYQNESVDSCICMSLDETARKVIILRVTSLRLDRYFLRGPVRIMRLEPRLAAGNQKVNY